MRHALVRPAILAAFAAPLFALAQSNLTPAQELANMREDFKILRETVGALNMRVEALERENAALSQKASGAQESYATLTQLNTAIADLSRDIKAAQAQTKSEVLQTVGTQMESLAKQTNAALDSVTRSRAAATAQTSFSDNFPKDGITYTVASGDTVSRIASKTGAKVADIINANKLADPTKIQVGQVLFVPGGK